MSHPEPVTLGQLKQTPYRYCPVKQELRESLTCALRNGGEFFAGIVGYRSTVLPQIIHAILSRHDMLFLGLRGQAKTRIMRMLPQLLDEWIPVLALLSTLRTGRHCMMPGDCQTSFLRSTSKNIWFL